MEKMEWQVNNSNSGLSSQEVAQEVLQMYVESLKDNGKLKSILSEYSILDYFGNTFYGKEEVCSHLTANLYGSNFELTSLTADDKDPSIDLDSICEVKACKKKEELGVCLMSIPSSSFPSLVFSTPMRTNSESRNNLKNSSGRKSHVNSLDYFLGVKKFKFYSGSNQDKFAEEGSPIINRKIELSPRAFRNVIPGDMKFLSSFGTICYSKRLSTFMTDPKRKKHHITGTLRDRFCHLYIGFQCDDRFISVTNCKIWIIKYGTSSKVTPRNLLKSFNEIEI